MATSTVLTSTQYVRVHWLIKAGSYFAEGRRPRAALSLAYFNFPCISTNGAMEVPAISLNSQQFHLRAAWKYERDRMRPAAKYEPVF